MRNLLDAADKLGPYQIVAVSDVYGPHRDAVKERSNGLATTHLDYREVLAQTSMPFHRLTDHWHVRMAVDALAAGKDVYLEKPVTHTLEESATLTRAVRSSKQILQCGMQQRSWTHFRDAVDLIQGGSLGRVPAGPHLLVAELSAGLGVPNLSMCRRSIGNFGWVPLRTSPSAKKNSIIGAGSGILAAAP